MDEFETRLSELIRMSEKDRDDAIMEFKTQCNCPNCPSYNECAKNAMEGLFCVLGKSAGCINDLKGCECPNCHIAKLLDVGEIFNGYCVNGSEMVQREKLHEIDIITGGE